MIRLKMMHIKEQINGLNLNKEIRNYWSLILTYLPRTYNT